jgi:hypothetical protein
VEEILGQQKGAGVIVSLTDPERDLALDHAGKLYEKILDHREKRGTYQTSGDQSRDHLSKICTAGILGEYAFRKAVGVNIPETIHISLDFFDGGRDVLWEGMRVQVKSALPRNTYSIDNPPWLLSPAANPVRADRCDLLALTVPWTENSVEIMGVLPTSVFLLKATPFPHDKTARGVRGGLWSLDGALGYPSGLKTVCGASNEVFEGPYY